LSDVARDGRTAVEAKLDAFEEKDLESIQWISFGRNLGTDKF
jgi:hypothetical protein